MWGLLSVADPGSSPIAGEWPRRSGPPDADQPFDPCRGWRLHPQVAVRPEQFGALLYHFGTRRLSFLKNRTILQVVGSLAEHPDARSACRAAGIAEGREGPYLQALGALASSRMLEPR